MREEVVIVVYANPAPGGSKTAYPIYDKNKRLVMKNGRPVIVVTDAGGKSNKLWKQSVNLAAFNQFKDAPWDCAIAVEFHFVLPRPKSHYGTGKNAHLLKRGTPLMHTFKPDLTKFIRSTEDALTGKLWIDDAQICQQTATKRYGNKPGVKVVMREAVAPVVQADVSEPDTPAPVPFGTGLDGQFSQLRDAVAAVPGDPNHFFIRDVKGVPMVFERRDPWPALLLHKADQHDLETLQRG